MQNQDNKHDKTGSYKNVLAGNWHQVKGKVKAKWGEFTDDDMQEIEGNSEALAGKIQARYGRSKAESLEEIKQWEKENNSN